MSTERQCFRASQEASAGKDVTKKPKKKGSRTKKLNASAEKESGTAEVELSLHAEKPIAEKGKVKSKKSSIALKAFPAAAEDVEKALSSRNASAEKVCLLSAASNKAYMVCLPEVKRIPFQVI